MKKVISIMCLFIIIFVSFINRVFAYGYELSVTSSSVTVGNSVTLNINVIDAAGKFTIASSDNSVLDASVDKIFIDSETKSVTLTAKKAGKATITVTAADVTSVTKEPVTGSKSVAITVNSVQIPSTNNNTNTNTNNSKRTNNYLVSLTVDDYKLDNDFDKEVLDYSLTVPYDTKKIKINAQLADSNAKVSGIGEVNVSSGINEFKIVVTAENGSKRTYTLKVIVEELDTIEVTIDKEKYSIVRKRENLPKISEYFVNKDITIGDNIIEGYYNETLDYNIVGLKDHKGNINLYINNNNEYIIYKEYVFNGITLQLLDKEVKGGYKKSTFTYDSDKIVGYQEVKLNILKNTYALDSNDIIGNQFYLFYAKNIESGKEELYQYDALEKTVQRVNIEQMNMYKKSSDTYYMYLLISIIVIAVLIVTILTIVIINKKKMNRRYEILSTL